MRMTRSGGPKGECVVRGDLGAGPRRHRGQTLGIGLPARTAFHGVAENQASAEGDQFGATLPLIQVGRYDSGYTVYHLRPRTGDWGAVASQILAVPSCELLTKRLPSGLKATHSTPDTCPFKVRAS